MDGHPGNIGGPIEELSSSLGWITRSARDLKLVFDALSQVGIGEGADLAHIRYVIAPSLRIRGVSPVESVIAYEVIKLSQKMSQHGLIVKETLDDSIFSNVLEIWLSQLRRGLNHIHQFAPVGTLGLSTVEQRQELTVSLRAKIERLTRGVDDDATKLKQSIRLFSTKLDQLLGQANVLILPVFPKCAFRHGESRKRPFDFAFTSIANIIGCPSVVVQIGQSQERFPIAVQLLARPGEDALVLAAAQNIENIVGEVWKSQSQ
jgi:Asp-tRNA(Asn)/Glu-tRNA(Gln) amidotransferase A subunit family amidase